MEIESLKREAAVAAVAEIRDGMRLGLGTGSTVSHLLDVLGERVREGLRVTCVPTSARTEAHARRLGIPLATLEETPELDLCIDGADEVDPGLDCLKGLGGACVREKVVAAASGRFVLIVDETKLVRRLGERAPVVVETIPFAVPTVMRALRAHNPVLRAAPGVVAAASAGDAICRFENAGAGAAPPYVTDNGNYLLELRAGPIADPSALAALLDATPGVLDHGLFLGMARAAYVASAGGVRKLERP